MLMFSEVLLRKLQHTLQQSLAKSKSRTSNGGTGIKANASLSSLTNEQHTFDITGLSSSTSMGCDVA